MIDSTDTNSQDLEKEVVAAFQEMESTVTVRDTVESQLRVAAHILENQPTHLKGPRLLFALGRMVYGLPVDDRQVIGREGEGIDLALPHGSMSRRHFQVRPEDAGFVIEDLHSRNGVEVNGSRVRRRRYLEDGDFIVAGGHEFLFLREDAKSEAM